MSLYISTTAIYTDRTTRINTSTVAPTILAAYITKSEAVINGYIAKLYTISQTVALQPPLLQSIAKDLTIYYTLSDQYTSDNQNMSDWLTSKKDDVMGLLEKISEGDIVLTHSQTALLPDNSGTILSSMDGIPLITNMDDEYEWKVSQALLDDIQADRDLGG